MKTQSPLAELTFDKKEKILHIKPNEGAEMDLEMAKEHYNVISKLVGQQKYLALVDASNYYSIKREAWEYIIDAGVNFNRVATAHYNTSVANELTTKFFISALSTLKPLKMFKEKKDALKWLKSFEL